ncbi:aa3-type cytochrome c oxidase subunit IV [Allopontixanthobacter sediminis]|nr:aa3-type cytochrome c oxidase subunit IV [Allopontixanthobacter sediminis]
MASPNDFKSAEKTYSSFIGTLKWSVPLIALITMIVVILIAS